jgi:hypothetical protein|nr:MAG TPA: hypothetical protein [Caudoviricetes sp.]
MKSKELVIICYLCRTCRECMHDKVCDAYYRQFKRYPFQVIEGDNYPPEADSDTEIQFP